jgi:Domain of unknown function (DUF4349)
MTASNRPTTALRAAIVVAVAFVAAACSGSASSSQILSTVGAPIGATSDQDAATSPPDTGIGTGGASGQNAGGDANPPAALRDDLKIVYTGSLQLVVDDLGASVAKAKAAVLATGGYIGGSNETNSGDHSVATVTYRIPATRWDDAIGTLRGLATKVVAEQTEATEVGGQIVDLEARLRSLRASEASLQAIAQAQGTVSDLLQVEAQLTNVRGQIEQIDGQRAQLEDQVAYGTLVTTFGLEIVQVKEAAAGWDPAHDVDGALATVVSAGQTLVSGAIWFGIVWLPLILVFAALSFAGRYVFRRIAPPRTPAGPVAGWGDGGGSAAG